MSTTQRDIAATLVREHGRTLAEDAGIRLRDKPSPLWRLLVLALLLSARIDARLAELLQGVTGIGPAGASIFLREVQAVWADLAPYLDDLTLEGARTAGLPDDPIRLAGLVPEADLVRLVSACVRVARDPELLEA
ncbi:hypothetical protein [Aeromicrobium sp. Sec7.5]|uniref:hypothetical protein n=1 Tax=Aeromicrobium sp. Sec7.5 TaxID=3121276 RepID=UPI002FE4587D